MVNALSMKHLFDYIAQCILGLADSLAFCVRAAASYGRICLRKVRLKIDEHLACLLAHNIACESIVSQLLQPLYAYLL